MKNQRGFAHMFLVLFLLVGLAVAVYLVQQKTNILPKASENQSLSAWMDCVSSNITLSITGNLLAPSNGNTVWFTATDERVNQSVIYGHIGSAGMGAPGTPIPTGNINANFRNYVNSIRGENSLHLVCDGRNYRIRAYFAPETSGVPQLFAPIAETYVAIASQSQAPTSSSGPSCNSVNVEGATYVRTYQGQNGTYYQYSINSGATARLVARVLPPDTRVNWKAGGSANLSDPRLGFSYPYPNNTSVVDWTAPNNPMTTEEGVDIRGDISEYPNPWKYCPTITFAVKPGSSSAGVVPGNAAVTRPPLSEPVLSVNKNAVCLFNSYSGSEVMISWINSNPPVSRVELDIGTPDEPDIRTKDVSSADTITYAPTGFSGSPELQVGRTYYIRLYYGEKYTKPVSFSIPSCMYYPR